MPAPRIDTRVLVTGANGFVGRNLLVGLREAGFAQIRTIARTDSENELRDAAGWAEVIVHLAGVNRPLTEGEFDSGNRGFTEQLAKGVRLAQNRPHIIFASSIQAERDNPYGRSKFAAERVLTGLSQDFAASVSIYRLPNLFGKWCRPDYNSVVANFCSAAARGRALRIDDPSAMLSLVYIDDLVAELLRAIARETHGLAWPIVQPEYRTSVGELATLVERFAAERHNLAVSNVGKGLERGLYATFLSHLEPEAFDYALTAHCDPRGSFVEVIKTEAQGQISYFTSRPGVIRGCHYHHTKTEKFIVVQGSARFRARHLITDERVDVDVTAGEPRVVQTIPGWTHDVINTGDDDLVVLVWANEVFDPRHPDTVSQMVEQ